MTRGERLFCDTNVLLCAVDRKRALNGLALHVLNDLPNQGVELCISGQVLREFIAVCSRPVSVNGLGLQCAEALANARAISARSTLLNETRDVAQRLLALLETTAILGKQVHDANIVATMLEHGVEQLITANPTHFQRFDQIRVIDLSATA